MQPLEFAHLTWTFAVSLAIIALLVPGRQGIWIAALLLFAGKSMFAATGLFGVGMGPSGFIQNSLGFDQLAPVFSWGICLFGLQAIAFACMVPRVKSSVGVGMGAIAVVATGWFAASSVIAAHHALEKNPTFERTEFKKTQEVVWASLRGSLVELAPLMILLMFKRQLLQARCEAADTMQSDEALAD